MHVVGFILPCTSALGMQTYMVAASAADNDDLACTFRTNRRKRFLRTDVAVSAHLQRKEKHTSGIKVRGM